MADAALHAGAGSGMIAARPKLDRTLDPRTVIIFLLLLAGGLLDVAYSLYEVRSSGISVPGTLASRRRVRTR